MLPSTWKYFMRLKLPPHTLKISICSLRTEKFRGAREGKFAILWIHHLWSDTDADIVLPTKPTERNGQPRNPDIPEETKQCCGLGNGQKD
jgi:hypothetical protein